MYRNSYEETLLEIIEEMYFLEHDPKIIELGTYEYNTLMQLVKKEQIQLLLDAPAYEYHMFVPPTVDGLPDTRTFDSRYDPKPLRFEPDVVKVQIKKAFGFPFGFLYIKLIDKHFYVNVKSNM